MATNEELLEMLYNTTNIIKANTGTWFTPFIQNGELFYKKVYNINKVATPVQRCLFGILQDRGVL